MQNATVYACVGFIFNEVEGTFEEVFLHFEGTEEEAIKWASTQFDEVLDVFPFEELFECDEDESTED